MPQPGHLFDGNLPYSPLTQSEGEGQTVSAEVEKYPQNSKGTPSSAK